MLHTVSEGPPRGSQPQVVTIVTYSLASTLAFLPSLSPSPYTPPTPASRDHQINHTRVLTWGAIFVVQSLSRVQLSPTP